MKGYGGAKGELEGRFAYIPSRRLEGVVWFGKPPAW